MSSYGAKKQLTTQQSVNLILQNPVMFKHPSNWSVVRLDFCLKENLRNGLYKPSEFLGKGQAKLLEISTLYNCDRVLKVNSSLKSILISEDEEHRYKIQDNDVLINRVSKRQEGVAQARIVRITSSWNQPVVFESNMLRARFDTEKIIPDFFSFYAATSSYVIQVLSKAQKGNQTSINQPALNSIILPLPPLPEQKTIAHTLRTIQKAKETHQRELELERERKAALMQYLFTHGTRNEPRKQTEIGKIPESWKIIKLGDLCSDGLGRIQTGPFGSQLHAYDYQPIGIPVVNPTHLRFNSISKDNIPRISKEKADSLTKHYLLEGDILISRRGDLSRYSYISKQYSGWLCGTGCLLIRLNNLKVNNYFCSILFSTEFIQTYLKLNAVGSIMPNLNTKILQSIPLKIPEIEEQIKIGEILHNCDRKIQALEKELTLIDELFHAMLEQLMTGKISTQPLTETYV